MNKEFIESFNVKKWSKELLANVIIDLHEIKDLDPKYKKQLIICLLEKFRREEK